MAAYTALAAAFAGFVAWRRSRRAGRITFAVLAVLLYVAAAETPFGIGDGKVPKLVGLDECTAAEKISERGLRFRFGSRAPIGGRPAACVSDELFSVADEVTGQRPKAGTTLDGGSPVVLETACTGEPGCWDRYTSFEE